MTGVQTCALPICQNKTEIVLSGDCLQDQKEVPAKCLMANLDSIRLQDPNGTVSGFSAIMKATDKGRIFPFKNQLGVGKCISTNREGGYGSLVCTGKDGTGFSAFVTSGEKESFVVSDIIAQQEKTVPNAKEKTKVVYHFGKSNDLAPKACGQIHSELGKSRKVLLSTPLGIGLSSTKETGFPANHKYVGWSVDLKNGQTCGDQN